jgi:hypothetical protein
MPETLLVWAVLSTLMISFKTISTYTDMSTRFPLHLISFHIHINIRFYYIQIISIQYTMSTIIIPRPNIPMDTVRISHSTDSIVTAVDFEEVLKPRARTDIKQGQSQDPSSIPPSHPDLTVIGTNLDTLFREKYTTLLKKGGRVMKIIAVIGSKDKGCLAYAKTIERCCQSLGVEFERVELDLGGTFEEGKMIVEGINKKEGVDVDGMIILTPIFGGQLVRPSPTRYIGW